MAPNVLSIFFIKFSTNIELATVLSLLPNMFSQCRLR